MSSCVFGAGGGLDFSRWRDERIQLSEREFRFRVPGGQSTSAPPGPTLSRVDLDRDLTRDKPALGIFNHTWDFDVGFWKGVMGKLQMTAGVYRRSDDYKKDLMSLENLQGLIETDLQQTYSRRNEERSQKGQERFNARLPDSYRRVKIRERIWLVYSLGGFFDRTRYTTPLTSDHYVTVTLDFSDNSRGYKTNWRQEAQTVADQIAASFEIR